VPHASSMLFDDGEVHCKVYEVYDPWLSQIYKYISKILLLESELDLLILISISLP